MNLPKDWSKKPDWLDKASESGGGGKVFFAALALLAIVGGIGAFVVSMLSL
jgi:hypothetical protein